jgi:hypothetical protein
MRLPMKADGSFERERVDFGQRKEIPLTRGLFAEDGLVFEGVKSAWVNLQGPHHRMKVSVNHAPWLGIWTKGKAPFLCIEPWRGHGDFTGGGDDFAGREGMIVLPQTWAMIFIMRLKWGEGD